MFTQSQCSWYIPNGVQTFGQQTVWATIIWATCLGHLGNTAFENKMTAVERMYFAGGYFTRPTVSSI